MSFLRKHILLERMMVIPFLRDGKPLKLVDFQMNPPFSMADCSVLPEGGGSPISMPEFLDGLKDGSITIPQPQETNDQTP